MWGLRSKTIKQGNDRKQVSGICSFVFGRFLEIAAYEKKRCGAGSTGVWEGTGKALGGLRSFQGALGGAAGEVWRPQAPFFCDFLEFLRN